MAGRKGMKHYALEFREKVVKDKIESNATLLEIQQKYGIASQAQVYNWCKWYEEYGVCKQVTGKKRGRPCKIKTVNEEQ